MSGVKRIFGAALNAVYGSKLMCALIFTLALVGCMSRLADTENPAATSQAVQAVSEPECPYQKLRRLECAEALARSGELQAAVDQVLQTAGFSTPISVIFMEAPLLGIHAFPRPDPARQEHLLMVTEVFLDNPNRFETIQERACLLVVAIDRHDSVRRFDAGIGQCMFEVAVESGDAQRARWLQRTLPPTRELPLLPQLQHLRWEPGCTGRGCRMAIDRLA